MDPLAEALEAGRSRFNTAFAQARRQRPRLQADVFSQALLQHVRPIVHAVAAVSPQAVAPTVEALYDLTLDLVGAQILMSHPEVTRHWEMTLQRRADLAAAAPRKISASIFNALYQLRNARMNDWARTMQALPTADGDEWLQAGQAAAWTCGLAQYRKAALEILSTLRPELRNSILPDGDVSALQRNPWYEGRHTVDLVARIGGFRGFGAPFKRPPLVQISDGDIYLTDGEDGWLLCADRFGMTFHPSPVPARSDPPSPSLRLTTDGVIHFGQQQRTFGVLKNPTSWASLDHTLVATLPRTHWVFIVGQP